MEKSKPIPFFSHQALYVTKNAIFNQIPSTGKLIYIF